MSRVSISSSLKLFAKSCNGFRGHVLAFDPGETTGWAWFHDYELVRCGQIETRSITSTWNNSLRLVTQLKSQIGEVDSREEVNQIHVAIEDYRIYSWKAKSHAWSDIHTIKVVGILELRALIESLPCRLRMAEHAKTFCTDTKLERWGFWQPGKRHARDAIRHAVLYIVDYRMGTKGKNK